jgi:tripartite-type tricarboxylate transporter receptor subunit TctC
MARLLGIIAAGALAFYVCDPPAIAAEWPSRPVRIIVPLAAGGAADTIGRTFGVALSTAFGQQFVIENRVGAGGIVGTEAVARSDPDGYTLMVSGMPFHVLAPVMNRNVTFDPMRDFTHIAYFGGTPIVLAVHASLGVKTFSDFSVLAEAKTGGIAYVSPGVGTVGNMVAERLATTGNLKLRHVPYRGGGAAILDLVAGHVKVGCLTWSTTLAHVRAGELIPIAISTAGRLTEFPDLPTFEELGFRDLVLTSWFSLSGPANLPRPIVEALNRAVNDSMAREDVRMSLSHEAVLTKSMTPEEFTRFVQSEVDKWTSVVKTLTPEK